MQNKQDNLDAALKELQRQMQTTDAEWPDVTWRVSQRFGVTYENLADAYDNAEQKQ